MASRQVTHRQKSAASVIAAGEANAEPIDEALSRILKPHTKKGEPVPSTAVLVTLLCGLLDAAAGAMVAADAAHEAELGDDEPVRAARDAAQTALRDELVELREVIAGAYGPQAVVRVFVGATPEDPVVLSRFAGEVAENLENTKLPAPRIKGAKLDVAEVTASLLEKRADLDNHLKRVQREVREAQKTLSDKNSAIAAYDSVFTGVAAALSGLLRLAGEPELASKVRPSARRPGQTAEDAGDEEPPAQPG